MHPRPSLGLSETCSGTASLVQVLGANRRLPGKTGSLLRRGSEAWARGAGRMRTEHILSTVRTQTSHCLSPREDAFAGHSTKPCTCARRRDKWGPDIPLLLL